MYVVQSRINGYVVDEERCVGFVEAQEALDRRRRLLVSASAAIIAEDAYRCVVARTVYGWTTVTIADGESH